MSVSHPLPPHPSKKVLRSFSCMNKYPLWEEIWNTSVHKEEFALVTSDFLVEFSDHCNLSSYEAQILYEYTEEMYWLCASPV